MYLNKIIETVRQDVEKRKKELSLAELRKLVNGRRPAKDFAGALKGPAISLIAEVKRASPSKGDLCPNLDVIKLVRSYEQGGAAAISVLTEKYFFKGSFNDLERVSKESTLPVLCKDFILDPYQVYQARGYGADAVLLIAAILSPEELKILRVLAEGLGMETLVEVHSKDEVEKAVGAGAGIIGINNRDLKDFKTDIKTTLELVEFIPSGITTVSESGIHSREDVLHLEAAGVNAILVGEALVTSKDPAGKIKELLGKKI